MPPIPKSAVRQNGKALPKPAPVPSDDELKSMTTERLVELANRGHQRFVGTLRRALVNDARLVGAVLQQLKARHQHGKWGDWLKANFAGSRETANLYMRIARHWHLVVQHGLDESGLSLEELRWIMSDSPGPRPGSEAAKEEKKRKKASMATEALVTDGGEVDCQPDPDLRQFAVLLDPDQAEELSDMSAKLQEAWAVPSRHDAVYRAVKVCYDQEVNRA